MINLEGTRRGFLRWANIAVAGLVGLGKISSSAGAILAKPELPLV
jgi:hypothetical protein